MFSFEINVLCDQPGGCPSHSLICTEPLATMANIAEGLITALKTARDEGWTVDFAHHRAICPTCAKPAGLMILSYQELEDDLLTCLQTVPPTGLANWWRDHRSKSPPHDRIAAVLDELAVAVTHDLKGRVTAMTVNNQMLSTTDNFWPALKTAIARHLTDKLS
jgi:hypothetical protein